MCLKGTEILNDQIPGSSLTIAEENVVIFSTGMKTGRRPTLKEKYNRMNEALKGDGDTEKQQFRSPK